MAAPKNIELTDYPPPAYTDPAANQPRPPLPRTHASSPLPSVARSHSTPDLGDYHYPPHTSLFDSSRRTFLVFLLFNTPLLIFIVIDVIITLTQPSKLYKTILLSVEFEISTRLISGLTCFFNAFFFYLFASHRSTPITASNTAIFLTVLIAVACVCSPLWTLGSPAMHDAAIVWPSCAEKGYASSVTVSVEVRRGASNITISSTDNILGLQLTPTVVESRDLDLFSVRAVQGLSSSGVWDSVSRAGGLGVDMWIDSTRRYGVSYNGSLRGGRFTDDRNFFLAFPELAIKSAEKRVWSSVDKKERPEVDLVENGSESVLITVDNQKKTRPYNPQWDRYSPVWEMCSKWSVAQMLEDREILEKTLVPVTRLGVEMELWATENKDSGE